MKRAVVSLLTFAATAWVLLVAWSGRVAGGLSAARRPTAATPPVCRW